MKKLTTLLLTVLLASTLGCSFLMPSKKEFFQKKVPTFPEKVKILERQKEAAAFVAVKVVAAYDEGLKAKVTNSVMVPLVEAKTIAIPLSVSLGHPASPYTGNPTNLAKTINKLEAQYETKLKELEGQLEPIEGKNITGTGLIQIGYFTYIGILIGIVILLYFAYKTASIFYPALKIGSVAVSTGASLVKRGFTEVIEGGEKFKTLVQKQITDSGVQEKVLALFSQAHKEAQSRDVQDVVSGLTNDPADPKTAIKKIKNG